MFPWRGREERKEMFGPHLTMDLYGCNKKKLKDVNFVFNFLDELPSMIGMTKIMPPYTFSYSGLKPEDWGVSGIVLIAESHISIHTFPEKNYASLDIFSCKDFDVESATDIIASKFEAKSYEKNFMMRGRHFPKDIVRNRQIIELERERESGRAKSE
ncbi:MAG: adenosylmethionine decarboxylase [Candidatus Micrarchaeia archaeon]|jgi:S-adenosylmethionine decarboxylase